MDTGEYRMFTFFYFLKIIQRLSGYPVFHQANLQKREWRSPRDRFLEREILYSLGF